MVDVIFAVVYINPLSVFFGYINFAMGVVQACI